MGFVLLIGSLIYKELLGLASSGEKPTLRFLLGCLSRRFRGVSEQCRSHSHHCTPSSGLGLGTDRVSVEFPRSLVCPPDYSTVQTWGIWCQGRIVDSENSWQLNVQFNEKSSKVVKGNSAGLIIQDLISQSLILQELETPPGWVYNSGSACTMKSIKHVKMYKCWHWLWPWAGVLCCPQPALSPLCCAQCPPAPGRAGAPRKVNPSTPLQNIFKSFVFIKPSSIWFSYSECGRFLRSSKQK